MLERQKVILVVGMHRSGTSAITRMVNLLGAELPTKLLGGNASNELGHWESEEIIQLHDAMLASANSSWNDVLGIDPKWFTSEVAKGFRRSITAFLSANFAEAELFAVKDPRLALFIPLWSEALSEIGLKPRCVLPYRNPLEVAASLASRSKHFASGEIWPIGRGLLLWLRYVLAAERSTRGLLRSFVDFDALLSDWEGEAVRLADQLDVAWPSYDEGLAKTEISRFLNQEHKHEVVPDAEASMAHTSPLYWQVLQQLHECVRKPDAGTRVFDEVAKTAEQSRSMFGGYVAALESQIGELSRKAEGVANGVTDARNEVFNLAVDARQRAIEIEASAVAARIQATRLGGEVERLVSLEDNAEAARTEATRQHIEALKRHLKALQPRTVEPHPHAKPGVASRLRNVVGSLCAMGKRAAQPSLCDRPQTTDAVVALRNVEAFARRAASCEEAWRAARSARLEAERGAVEMGGRASEAEAMAVVIAAEAARMEAFRAASEVQDRRASQDDASSRAEVTAALRAEVDQQEALRFARNQERRALQAEAMVATIRREAARAEALRLAVRTVPYSVIGPNKDYARWVELYDSIAESDRIAILSDISSLQHRPLFSIIMVVHNTAEALLRASIASVQAQLYPDWELTIVDDASTDLACVRVLVTLAELDERIKWRQTLNSIGVSQCANSGLELTKGEFVAWIDPRDVLAEHALYEIAKRLQAPSDIDIIYSDEDQIDDAGTRHDPFFKTDWNPELLLSYNYVGQFSVFRRSLVESVGNLRSGFEGSQDYDLVLRASRMTKPSRISHVPTILYHRRAEPGQMAYAESSLDRSLVAARLAIEDHLKFFGHAASVEAHNVLPFWHRVRRPLPERAPSVTIIVPTRDRPHLIGRCIDGLLRRTNYPLLEILIVDHETADAEALALLEGFKSDARVRVVSYDGPFNYSAINNMAVRQARGEFVTLLNSDVDVIDPGWLSEMIVLAVVPGTGAVGAKLLYPDGRVQHGGVILGAAESAGHYFHLLERNQPGYQGRAMLVSNVSAVTAACLVVRKTIYEEVGGLDEMNLPVVYNDVDFCLRLLRNGYRNVWTPYAELFHHESASRGPDVRSDAVLRLHREKRYLIETWGSLLNRDPFYNPNFSLTEANFTLAFPPRRAKTWEQDLSSSKPKRMLNKAIVDDQ